MILVNKKFKDTKLSKARKQLKKIASLVREQLVWCEDDIKVELSFTLESKDKFFDDKGMNSFEWRVVTIWMIEIGAWKIDDNDEDECAINWYFKK